MGLLGASNYQVDIFRVKLVEGPSPRVKHPCLVNRSINQSKRRKSPRRHEKKLYVYGNCHLICDSLAAQLTVGTDSNARACVSLECQRWWRCRATAGENSDGSRFCSI